MIAEHCFAKNAENDAITNEEFKKLAKAWKLNDQRNFWKNHAAQDDLIDALLRYKNDNFSMRETPQQVAFQPTPPTSYRPSPKEKFTLKNYCGARNRDKNPDLLCLHSRHTDFPDTQTNVRKSVERWRGEDFHMKDPRRKTPEVMNKRATNTRLENSGSQMATAVEKSHQNRVQKHRSLAKLLLNFSANPENIKKRVGGPESATTTLNSKSIETFINVAESKDPEIVSDCIIAISNISMYPSVRTLLYEGNAISKVSNLLNHIPLKGSKANWASLLLFYYFSCDKDIEDRVYNAGGAFIHTCSQSPDPEIKLVALYTLNNLALCIERQKIAEALMLWIATDQVRKALGGP